MSNRLKDCFIETMQQYEGELRIIVPVWEEIAAAYTAPGRHYHNLTHLEHMLDRLQDIKAEIGHWDTVMLALFYHDFVYEPLQSNNEEESAAIAVKKLKTIAFHHTRVKAVADMILATKAHETHSSNDINLFTDADLSVLGADSDAYRQYAAAIRREYAVVPDALYIPGRRKVLEHFLNMEHIFKTARFRDLYEKQARINLAAELAGLHLK